MRIRRPLSYVVLLAFGFATGIGCDRDKKTFKPVPPSSAAGAGKATTLAEARRGFQTSLARQEAERQPVPKPPANELRVVHYDSPAGKMAAYLSIVPRDNVKRPAIIWIFGGFGNGIGETAWERAPANNDQSASAFRKAGVITMYPALRGGNDNPGFNESFFGEVDDVLAAADFLAKQDGVDPSRIYLGGHSTGGTLALLVAAAAPERFRAVFSFGPVAHVAGYGAEQLTYDLTNAKESELRAPMLWLDPVKSPTFVIEGAREGNADSVRQIQRATNNSNLQFFILSRGDHFNILAPVSRVIAGKVARDTGTTTNLKFTQGELDAAIR